MLWIAAPTTIGRRHARQLKRGDFKFRLAGEKLSGEFALVRMKRVKGNEWLLIKKRDSAAQPGWDPEDHSQSVLTGRTQEEIARGLDAAPEPEPAPSASAMPKIVAPMLAELGKGTPPATGDWIYEIKWDGVRPLFHRRRQASGWSRAMSAIDKQYPDFRSAASGQRARRSRWRDRRARCPRQPSFERSSTASMAEASSIARLSRNGPRHVHRVQSTVSRRRRSAPDR
jgi:ATP-dependent DNA ligase